MAAAIVSDSLSLPSHNTANGLFYMLPEEILHQILYSLNLRQRTIASIVCTKWHHMISSFDDKKFVNRYSTNCVIKFPGDNSPMKEFYCSSKILLTPKFFNSRLLTVLHLKGCNMNRIGHTDFSHIKPLFSLKEMYLDSVRIDPPAFSRLINEWCPSIEELTMIHCHDICSSILVPDLIELKKVHVNYGRECIRQIEIKARNLQEFHLFSSYVTAVDLDLCSCTKLQVLKIDCRNIPFGFPQVVLSVFPRLKSLFLRLCRGLRKIRISSPELESLSLIDMVDLDDAIMVTPNLHSFNYRYKKIPKLASNDWFNSNGS